jgi:hypothetical protein
MEETMYFVHMLHAVGSRLPLNSVGLEVSVSLKHEAYKQNTVNV